MALGQVTKKRAPRKAGATGVQLGEDGARALILRGGAQVFADVGVRAASVEDILKAAGVSRRTFYRFYASKEDVLVALYRLGTEELLTACRSVIEANADPLVQIQGCIDAHLRNARDLGRLVFVLGGEAHRQESALHARRMEVHDALVTMLTESAQAWSTGGTLTNATSSTKSATRTATKTVKKAPGRTKPGTTRSAFATDPLLYRGLMLALEGVTRSVLEAGNEGRNVSDAAIDRARQVMRRMATASLAGEGKGVTPLPPALSSPTD